MNFAEVTSSTSEYLSNRNLTITGVTLVIVLFRGKIGFALQGLMHTGRRMKLGNYADMSPEQISYKLSYIISLRTPLDKEQKAMLRALLQGKFDTVLPREKITAFKEILQKR